MLLGRRWLSVVLPMRGLVIVLVVVTEFDRLGRCLRLTGAPNGVRFLVQMLAGAIAKVRQYIAALSVSSRHRAHSHHTGTWEAARQLTPLDSGTTYSEEDLTILTLAGESWWRIFDNPWCVFPALAGLRVTCQACSVA